MFIPSLMKGKFNFHADSVGMGFKNCWVLWSLQIHSGCRSWQNHSTPRTEMSIFSLGLNQPSASLLFRNRDSNRTPSVFTGSKAKNRKDLPSFAITKLQDQSLSHSVVFRCSELPTSLQPEVIWLLTGLNWFLFGGLGREFSRKSPQ